MKNTKELGSRYFKIRWRAVHRSPSHTGAVISSDMEGTSKKRAIWVLWPISLLLGRKGTRAALPGCHDGKSCFPEGGHEGPNS